MKLLIYGGGTIGLSYAWLLSAKHDISVLVRPERKIQAQHGFQMMFHDLRNKPKTDAAVLFQPRIVTDIGNGYDAVLVTVNRCQLAEVLSELKDCQADIIFMQNNWALLEEVSLYLKPERYLVGFPSQVGGGRDEQGIEVNVYSEGTVLGEVDGGTTDRLIRYRQAFEEAGLSVEVKPDILSWMKVHYLQQSISAGAILKAGSYIAFARSYQAIKEMVYAFREGIHVCQACGIDTKRIFPASLFRYPAPLVAFSMKRMFNDPNTVIMVTGHMKQGITEWIAGYYEVLETGHEKGVPMPVWKSYKSYVDGYVQK